MKNIELFAIIFRQTRMGRFLVTFLIVYLACCLAIWLIDPAIPTFWDGLWFGFMVVTTIGFGDFTVTLWSSRMIAAILGIYGILLSGFICGVGSSYLFAKIKMGRDESVSQMVWQLEHLDQLSDDQISILSKKIEAAHQQNMKAAAASRQLSETEK